MNPFLPLIVGTGVGLTYKLDVEEAITRAGITTGVAYALNTPTGRKVLLLTGAVAYETIKDLVIVPTLAAAQTKTGSAIGGAVRLGGGIAAGVVIGYGIGVGVGTVAAYAIDDKRGAEAARELYTGQVRSQEYQATLLGAIASVIT